MENKTSRRNWFGKLFGGAAVAACLPLNNELLRSSWYGMSSRIRTISKGTALLGVSDKVPTLLTNEYLLPKHKVESCLPNLNYMNSLENGDESCYTYSYDTNMFLEG
jgi:hypothetical protein